MSFSPNKLNASDRFIIKEVIGDTLQNQMYGIDKLNECGQGTKIQENYINEINILNYFCHSYQLKIFNQYKVEVKQYRACCRKYRYHKSEQCPLPNLNGKTNIIDYSDIKKNVMSLRPTTTTRSKPNVFKSKSIMNVEYVPSNSILQSLDPYDYAMYLYIKYIIDGSDLQINIPSKTRKNLTKFLIKTDKTDIILMDDYTDQMCKLYDKAWEQIHTLIESDSYSRFKYTKEDNDLCIRAKEEDDKNAYASDFLNKPKPSILDWKYNETVMISNYSGANTSIPEEAELEMHDYEEEQIK